MNTLILAYRKKPYLFVLPAITLLLFLRRPDAFLNPQFWAEDGMFYVDALISGVGNLATPYNGYLHLAPRLTALGSTLLDPIFAPTFYIQATTLLTLLVIGRIFSPRFNLPFKPLLAFVVVLLPDAREILLTVTNIQWILAIGLIILLLSNDAARPVQWSYDLGLTFLGGLSGPFSILLAPLFIVRALTKRSQASWVLAAAICTTALIQLWFVFYSVEQMPDKITAFRWSLIPAILGLRLGTLLFAGGISVSNILWLSAIGFVGIVILVIAALWNGERKIHRFIILVSLALFLAASFYRYRLIQYLYLEPHISPRYFFVPQVLVLWLLIQSCASKRPFAYLSAALLTAFLLTNLRYFRLEPFVDLHWKDYADKIRDGKSCEFPVNPSPIIISCPPIHRR